MGVICYNMEVTSCVPPARLFNAFVLDNDNLIAKVLPQAVKNVEIIEGDGGPGTIRMVTFGEGGHYKYMKERIDAMDKGKFIYGYSVLEGDALADKIEKISNEIKFEASPDGGSLCKSSSKYYTIGDFDLKEEEIKAGMEKAMSIFRLVEGHLLANPDVAK